LENLATVQSSDLGEENLESDGEGSVGRSLQGLRPPRPYHREVETGGDRGTADEGVKRTSTRSLGHSGEGGDGGKASVAGDRD
jgi:hypothetical protein